MVSYEGQEFGIWSLVFLTALASMAAAVEIYKPLGDQQEIADEHPVVRGWNDDGVRTDRFE